MSLIVHVWLCVCCRQASLKHWRVFTKCSHGLKVLSGEVFEVAKLAAICLGCLFVGWWVGVFPWCRLKSGRDCWHHTSAEMRQFFRFYTRWSECKVGPMKCNKKCVFLKVDVQTMHLFVFVVILNDNPAMMWWSSLLRTHSKSSTMFSFYVKVTFIICLRVKQNDVPRCILMRINLPK